MIIITGAATGVGRYLFDHFSPDKVVVGTYHRSSHGNQHLQELDIRNFDEIEAWRAKLNYDQMKQTTLINCAAINYNAFAHKADPQEWRQTIETNLIGTFNMIRSFLPHMREMGYGRIINFSSVVTKRPVTGASAYIASKTAISGLTKALALENASRGITINDINLGYSNIGMGVTQITADQRKDLTGKIPTGRFCEPEEIVSTIEYLISNPYINGAAIDLNGALA